MKGKTTSPEINLDENMTVHCKAYIQPSLDKAIKFYQANEIETTGENITYSEAVRRLLYFALKGI